MDGLTDRWTDRFGFIERFTTTFMHTHHSLSDRWGWLMRMRLAWNKIQKTLDTSKWLHRNKTWGTRSAGKGLDSQLCHYWQLRTQESTCGEKDTAAIIRFCDNGTQGGGRGPILLVHPDWPIDGKPGNIKSCRSTTARNLKIHAFLFWLLFYWKAVHFISILIARQLKSPVK